MGLLMIIITKKNHVDYLKCLFDLHYVKKLKDKILLTKHHTKNYNNKVTHVILPLFLVGETHLNRHVSYLQYYPYPS